MHDPDYFQNIYPSYAKLLWLGEYCCLPTSTLAVQGILRDKERPCSLGASQPRGAFTEAWPKALTTFLNC